MTSPVSGFERYTTVGENVESRYPNWLLSAIAPESWLVSSGFAVFCPDALFNCSVMPADLLVSLGRLEGLGQSKNVAPKVR